MSHKPTRIHSTSNLPDGKTGDVAFHTDTRKPMFWDNGWTQFDDEYRGPVDLFIIAGQSNAHGHARINGLNDDQITTNDVYFYTSWHENTSNATTTQYYSEWATDVVAGSTRGDSGESTLNSEQFGPELGFARRAKQLSSTRARIGIVKHAIGASSLGASGGYDIVVENGEYYRCKVTHTSQASNRPYYGASWGDFWEVTTSETTTNAWAADTDYTGVGLSDWDLAEFADDVREGDALRGWKRAVDDAASKLTALNITYRWRGLIWWQGESGTDTTNVQLLWAHMRDYLNAPDLAIVATRLGYGAANNWTSGSVFTNTSNVAVVDATDFGHSGAQNHVGEDNNADPRDMFNIGMEYANKFADLFGESPIAKLSQTILFPSISDKTTASANFDLEATSNSGLNITYTSSDTSVVTITGKTVTIVSAGTATITASQAGDNSYLAAADVTQNITVNTSGSSWEPSSSDTIWWVDPSESGSVRTVTHNTSSDPNNDTWVEDTTYPPVAGDYIIVKTTVTLSKWTNGGSGSTTFTTGDILEVWMIQNGGSTVTMRDPNNTVNFEYITSGRGTQWEVAKAPDNTNGVIDKINLKTSSGTLANYPGLIKDDTTISTTTINSRQALRFGAPGSSTTGDTYLTIPGGYSSNAIPTDAHIWYFLVKPFDIGTDASPTLDGSLQVGATGNTYIYLAQNGKFYFGASNSFSGQSTTLTNDQLNLLAFELDWASDTIKIYLNGELDFTGDTMDGTTTASGAAVDIQVPDSGKDWSLFHYNNSYLEGDLCEFIASTAVDKTTRQKTEGYLAHKWGFTDLLLDEDGNTTTHPYKSSAPS